MKATKACLTALIMAAASSAWANGTTPDPYEPYNRVMFNINDTADRYVLEPVARGYRAVTPRPVRTGVSNFFNNLRDVVSMGSNLLRLDIKRASEDLVRVGINTTFGLGGLIDIARAGGVPDNKSTLGDTFASWGWKNSNYFIYPLAGPSTVRDSVGRTIISAYPVQNTFLETPASRVGTTVLGAVDTREKLLDLTSGLNDAALDKYTYTRDLFMQVRARQLGIPPQEETEEINIDDLVGDTASEATSPTPAAKPETELQTSITEAALPSEEYTAFPSENTSESLNTSETLQ